MKDRNGIGVGREQGLDREGTGMGQAVADEGWDHCSG